MRADLALVLCVLASGCYASHEGALGDASLPDAGPSVFAGRWLVDQPTHALYEATIYDLRDDHWTEEVCTETFGGPVPTGVVERTADGLRCHFDGPWQSRHEGELAIDAYCDDSASRTVVLTVSWGTDGAPSEVVVEKVDGERGWVHPWPEWRWLPCARFPDECEVCR